MDINGYHISVQKPLYHYKEKVNLIFFGKEPWSIVLLLHLFIETHLIFSMISIFPLSIQ